MGVQKPKIQKRNVSFDIRTKTKIWQEIPSDQNPYLAEHCRCHGYDILELAQKRSFVDVLFLLFLGELPRPEQTQLLETLLIAMINPGPRHPATRATMNAGVGKTRTSHLLPIGLSILGSSYLGGEEVIEAMTFLRRNRTKDPAGVASELLVTEKPENGDWHIAPGFGSRFSSIDPQPRQLAEMLNSLPGCGNTLKWGLDFVKKITPCNLGWLNTGLAAAVFCDLGFQPRAGAGLFQLICAPGILAHGLELANKPITAMPFLDEDHYVIEQKVKKK